MFISASVAGITHPSRYIDVSGAHNAFSVSGPLPSLGPLCCIVHGDAQLYYFYYCVAVLVNFKALD